MSLARQQVKGSEQSAPTAQQSHALMRNLLRTAISAVCYLRGLFPEDCFQDRNLTGINIKALIGGKNDNARRLCSWLEEGVFDALERQYLRVLIFGIGKSADELVEAYTFTFNYGDQSTQLAVGVTRGGQKEHQSVHAMATKEEIKNATILMLRNIITLAQTLQPVSDLHHITMKLLYHEDRTPADYEPRFFRCATGETPLSFAEKPVKLKLGHVRTQHHSLAVKAQTTLDTVPHADEVPATPVPRENAEKEEETASPPHSPLLVYSPGTFSTPPPNLRRKPVPQERAAVLPENLSATALQAAAVIHDLPAITAPALSRELHISAYEARNLLRSYEELGLVEIPKRTNQARRVLINPTNQPLWAQLLSRARKSAPTAVPSSRRVYAPSPASAQNLREMKGSPAIFPASYPPKKRKLDDEE